MVGFAIAIDIFIAVDGTGDFGAQNGAFVVVAFRGNPRRYGAVVNIVYLTAGMGRW